MGSFVLLQRLFYAYPSTCVYVGVRIYITPPLKLNVSTPLLHTVEINHFCGNTQSSFTVAGTVNIRLWEYSVIGMRILNMAVFCMMYPRIFFYTAFV